ncbi:MAG: type II toxin-antitoxin system prevent-host-death family antitoxin [Chloroflexota bacterium]
MQKTISATKARIHFGEIMKQAKVAPVIVERGGKAEVVVLSKKAYDRLVAGNQQTDWQKKLEDLHKRIKAELAGRTLPDPAELIRLGREERDEQLLGSLR